MNNLDLMRKVYLLNGELNNAIPYCKTKFIDFTIFGHDWLKWLKKEYANDLLAK